MDTQTSTDGSTDAPGDTDITLPRIVDWAVSIALILSGLLGVLFGSLFYAGADRSTIADLVADGTIQSTMLSDAELIDVTYALAWWGGLGLLVVGALLIIAGIGYAWYRYRARQTGAPTTAWPHAVIGAVVSMVTAFVPLSPLIGGIVAGYLEGGTNNNRARVGALSGLVASIPMVILFVFLIGGFIVVAMELNLGIVSAVGAIGLIVGLFVAVLYFVGLSALGAYLSTAIDDSQEPTETV